MHADSVKRVVIVFLPLPVYLINNQVIKLFDTVSFLKY